MKTVITSRYIKVKLQFEAIHCWPECPIEEVAFLKYPHRHTFYVTCVKPVKHNDRDIEIIQFKRQIQKYIEEKGVDLGKTSCEDLAEEIMLNFSCSEVEVLEDNENGAIVCQEEITCQG